MIAVEPFEKPAHPTSSLTYLRSIVAEPAFNRLTTLAARLLNARVAAAVVIDDSWPVIKSLYVRGRDKFDPRLLDGFSNRVFESGQTVVVGNTLAVHEGFGDAGGIRAFIGIPLVVDDEVHGCLCVIDYKVRRWTLEQLALVSDVASGLQRELELRAEIKARHESEKRLRQWLCDLEIVNSELEAYGHTIAHNIKGPLNTIANFAGLLQLHSTDNLSDEALSNIDEILNGIQSMAEMTDQLLQLAKLRNASADMEFVDVVPLVERALARFAPLLHEHNIQVEIQPGLLPAVGHAAWIEEVFANLIANAINYRDRQKAVSKITIHSRIVEDMIAYEVQDNGIGISAENQKRLFSQFVRLNESSGTRGYGLGLSIVHRLVRRMNGQVEIRSVQGEGSTFCFMLPSID